MKKKKIEKETSDFSGKVEKIPWAVEGPRGKRTQKSGGEFRVGVSVVIPCISTGGGRRECSIYGGKDPPSKHEAATILKERTVERGEC